MIFSQFLEVNGINLSFINYPMPYAINKQLIRHLLKLIKLNLPCEAEIEEIVFNKILLLTVVI